MARVLITGAGRGIGRDTALRLARAGHRVHATLRDPASAADLAGVAADGGLPLTLSPLDVDDGDSVARAVAAIERDDGPIDVLVNNAGLETRGSVEETPLAAFRAVMETNYFGALRCIQAVLPGMRARRAGCIVNVTSLSGRIASSPLGAYAASKFALEALSEALAQEVKPFGIRVAIVQPAIVDTAMARRVAAPAPDSPYPHVRRMARLFAATLAQPKPASAVAETILGIIEGPDGPLRHPVGEDALAFLRWRASLSDEQWVDHGAADDAAWYASILRDFGLDLRGDD